MIFWDKIQTRIDKKLILSVNFVFNNRLVNSSEDSKKLQLRVGQLKIDFFRRMGYQSNKK